MLGPYFGSTLYLQIGTQQRADGLTRTADLLITNVMVTTCLRPKVLLAELLAAGDKRESYLRLGVTGDGGRGGEARPGRSVIVRQEARQRSVPGTAASSTR